jgi:NADPH:quinone reductase
VWPPFSAPVLERSLNDVVLEEVRCPPGREVLIAVRAFGLNHADTYMRSGVWSFGIDVLGIECAGVALRDTTGALAPGTTVVALVGGYATAWVALHGNLALAPGHRVLVRGATSSVGQAAVNLAVDHGATVVATTRAADRVPLLRRLGAHEVLLDDGALAGRLNGGVDRVLDLVGNAVLRDSLHCARPHGRVCQIGFLGGLEPVADFNPLADLPSGVQLSTFASAFVLGEEPFPLARVPLQEIVTQVERGAFDATPKRVFAFDEIADAHRLMDAGRPGGKLVVTLA